MPTASERATGTLHEIGDRDHSTTSEYRIYGPPGAGKTTSMARQIRRAVEKYGTSSILVTSFSRAAAAELAGRDLPVERDRVGTLHSHCYRALGSPAIAEAHLEDWNRRYPNLRLTPARKQARLDGEDGFGDDGIDHNGGDAALQELNRLRGRMTPQKQWSSAARQFERMWKEYKRANDLLDFTDLIETCSHDLAIAPGQPSVIFADEAQDLNPMQMSLVRKWGENAQYFILAGDDDQTVYTFAGASPDAILDPDIPDDHKIVLKQSWRVPRAVQLLAERTIRQVARRQEKIYLPRPEQGVVHKLSTGTYKSPEYFILRSAQEHLGRGETVMFLASCAYMLSPLLQVLRKHGIPFHNPYRRANGFWNPLRLSSRGSAASRVLSLLAPQWTWHDFGQWTEWMYADRVLLPGAAATMANRRPEDVVTISDLVSIIAQNALDSLIAAYDGGAGRLVRWWRARLRPEYQDRVRYATEVVMASGTQGLTESPRVIVGTIHSVKGGEADVVYLFPDLSRSGDTNYHRGGADRDAITRLFYVGITRARSTLYICQRETAMAFSI